MTAVFEHLEPRADGLPSWLDLDVPDDRFVASALLLQSSHPGSRVYVATSDLNLQTQARCRRSAVHRAALKLAPTQQPAAEGSA